jgi:lysophospholipid acyltransferase (LPLAT)-like uncharacterized protein
VTEEIGADPKPAPAMPAWVGVAAFAASLVLRLLRRSVRLRFHDDRTIRAWERGEQRFLLAFWHRHLPLMRYAYRGRRMSVLVSRSKDGELIARTMAHLGIDTRRGSSSRGGSTGLREMLRAARSGSDIAITPDGPRGPLREVQPGVVLLAAASGLPLIPVAIAASRARELRSWDRMPIPLPGSRVEVVYGEPLRLPRDARAEEWAPRLRDAINAVEERACRLAAGEARA